MSMFLLWLTKVDTMLLGAHKYLIQWSNLPSTCEGESCNPFLLVFDFTHRHLLSSKLDLLWLRWDINTYFFFYIEQIHPIMLPRQLFHCFIFKYQLKPEIFMILLALNFGQSNHHHYISHPLAMIIWISLIFLLSKIDVYKPVCMEVTIG